MTRKTAPPQKNNLRRSLSDSARFGRGLRAARGVLKRAEGYSASTNEKP